MFSILLPTRNRPEKALRAVQSILDQGRNDVQIVVADNSDSDTFRTVMEEKNIPNLQYVRTGGLSASENWTAGAPYCTGRYILYLLDREILLPGTLDRLAFLAGKYPDIPICWQEALPIGAPPAPQGECLVAAKELIDGLLCSSCGINNNVEMRAHTICYPHTVYQKVIAKLKNRIITEEASDLAGPLQMLFFVDACIYIPERIKRTTLTSSQTAKDMLFFEAAIASTNMMVEKTYSHVPIKHFFVLNHILNGMLKLCEENGYKISLTGDVLEEYFCYMYTMYMRAVEKYHIPAHEFTKAFFTAAVEHDMQGKPWFNQIFYFWNWPEWYSGE